MNKTLPEHHCIPVFFDPRQSTNAQSFSPSASSKPMAVINDWTEHDLPVRLMPVRPVTRDDLCMAHSSPHVDAILSLQRDNGFGTSSQAVVESLY